MDAVDCAFDELYQAFVAGGGLDQTDRIVNEDAERMVRQSAYCKHGLPRTTCPGCRPSKDKSLYNN